MKKQDTVIVEDKAGRRRFIRAGAAFLLAGAATANAQEEEQFRSDCDSVGYGGEKNSEMANTDSDSGASADRPGCGRKPTLTRYRKEGHKNIKVGKVIA